MAKAPAFQFYASDFLSDERVDLMTNAEVGVYVRLLSRSWLEGSIPADPAKLARLVREEPKAFAKIWPAVSDLFVPGAVDGRLVNPKLESVRAQQLAYRERMAELSARGVAARAANNAGQPNDAPFGEPCGSPSGQPEMPTTSTSTSGLRQVQTPSESAPRAKKDPKPEPDTAWVDELKAAYQPIYGKRLRDLTIDERVVLARYHAFKFGNCTLHEPTNTKRAQNVLKGLGGMCVDATYGELTVRDYVSAAIAFTEKAKAGPWFDPWLIKSVMVPA